MIQIQESGKVILPSPREVRRMRKCFHQDHHLRLPRFIEPALLRDLQREIETSRFRDDHRPAHVGGTFSMARNRLAERFYLLFNDFALFRLIDEITGCGPVGCFFGQVYRYLPSRGHGLIWHTDAHCDRLIALTLNLSLGSFRGGVLEMRRQTNGRPIFSIANTEPASAILFPVSSKFEHRVTEVKGTRTRTTYVGWFHSQPDFYRGLKKILRSQNARNADDAG